MSVGSAGASRGAVVGKTFRSLGRRNYRLFFAGELVSNTGSWMQTMAEAWLVLRLTHSGTAVGATFGFRFAPVLLFGLWGGAVVDRFDRRKVLILTQSLSALLAVALWLIVATGAVHVWMVFGLAFGLGLVTVVDQPAHQAFLEEIVGADHVANAVALQNAVTNSARITGPAIAGLVIAGAGVSVVFFANALSFMAVVAALAGMRRGELFPHVRPVHAPKVREGVAYLHALREIRGTLILIAVVGTLVYNFPTFLTLLARDSFHGGASTAGLLMAVLGAGTVVGALVAANHARPSPLAVVGSAALLGGALLLLAAVPARAGLITVLVPVGALAVYFGSAANAHMQVSSAPQFRGRVMSAYSLLTNGTTVIGGPLVGWVCQRWDTRAGFAMAGTATAIAAVAVALLMRSRRAVPTEGAGIAREPAIGFARSV